MSRLSGREVLQELGAGFALKVPWCTTHHASAAFSDSARCTVGAVESAARGQYRDHIHSHRCHIDLALVIAPRGEQE